MFPAESAIPNRTRTAHRTSGPGGFSEFCCLALAQPSDWHCPGHLICWRAGPARPADGCVALWLGTLLCFDLTGLVVRVVPWIELTWL
jgi:hypothetical protein